VSLAQEKSKVVVHFDDGGSQELMASDRISPGARNFVIGLLGKRSSKASSRWGSHGVLNQVTNCFTTGSSTL